ncbi:isopeptide-forming domain-containing fimbrial protein, partial [Guggenheimella bovis]
MKDFAKRLLSVTLALLMVVSNIPTDGLFSTTTAYAANSTVTSSSVGEVKNVRAQIFDATKAGELCNRLLEGRIDFTWPDSRQFVDLVIIQDMSGSFKNTIVDVGNSIYKIVDSLNMGNDVDGKSPMDRAMLVTYKGSPGTFTVDSSRYTSYTNSSGTWPYKVQVESVTGGNLSSNKTNFLSMITNVYQAKNAWGGTPTIDGMREAQRQYQTLTSGTAVYNNTDYTINGAKRTRKTIYLLISDGAANVVTYNNIPESSRQYFFTPKSLSTAYYFDDWYSNSTAGEGWYLATDGYYYPRYRFPYLSHLYAMYEIGQELKATGGLDSSSASVVTGFWEDPSSVSGLPSTGAYYASWPTMRPDILYYFEYIASQKDYFTTSDKIESFTESLIKTFQTANTKTLDRVDINLVPSIGATSYELWRKGDNPATVAVETEYQISAGPYSKVSGSSITVDMTNYPAANYFIKYKASELEYQPTTYNPLPQIDFTYSDITQSLNTTALTIDGNTRTDCSIDVRKYVASDQADFANKNDYKQLDNRRQSFYFDSVYTFTGQVYEINNSMVLQDSIDQRLDILDVYLVTNSANRIISSNAPNGYYDVLSGASTNNTLVAEMKGGVSGDLTGVPAISVDKATNMISYNLPKQPTVINGVTYPFGGYDKKEYILVVKAQIKDSVTDDEIDHMINTIVDGRPAGIPNTSKITTDGKLLTSNTVRVVPPELTSPDLKKYISTIAEGTQFDPLYWMAPYAYLYRPNEPYLQKLEFTMPTDMTGYDTLVLTDPVDPFLTIDPMSIRTYILKKDRTKIPITVPNPNYMYGVDSNNVLTMTFAENAPTEQFFEQMSDGKLVVEFKVTLKDGVDLTQRYHAATNTYRYNNTASYKLNGNDPKYSNQTTAIAPTISVRLKKLAPDGSVLQGAVFELRDKTTTNTESPESYTTDDNGLLITKNLTPGKTYELQEIQAPDGYTLVDNTPWTIVVNKDNTVTITGGPTMTGMNNTINANAIEITNLSPKAPTPEKWLHGALDADKTFKQPTVAAPYLLQQNGEVVTYQIRIPITDVNGFSSLEINDKFDKYLNYIPQTAKSFVLNETDPFDISAVVGGSFSIDDTTKTLKWIKTANFNEIVNKTLVIQFQATVDGPVDKIFSDASQTYYSNGIVPNSAEVVLNTTSKATTNEVAVQVTKAEVTLSKQVIPKGTSTPIPQPDGSETTFTLYKLRDGATDPDPGKDSPIGSYSVKGSEQVKVPLLDSGKYYFVETSAPAGYQGVSGPILPLITVPAGSTGNVASISPVNPEVETPTISKKIRSYKEDGTVVDKPFTKDLLQIGFGWQWQYAIDIPFPAATDLTKTYTIADMIPAPFEILNLVVQEGDGTTFTDSTQLTQELNKNMNWTNRNDLKLILTGQQITDFGLSGKTVRILVTVHVKPGTNLLESGYLQRGVIPNTATLTYEGGNFSSTVDVQPKIVRNFEFTKMLGGTPLPGATFTLYPFDPTTRTVSPDPAVDPFTGMPLKATSTDMGIVAFKNVPAGQYIMREAAPSGTYPYYESIRVVVSDSAIPTTDPNAIRFYTKGGIEIIDSEVYNNESVVISGQKYWDDLDNTYSRPLSIHIRLYRTVEGTTTRELVEERDISAPWTYEFKDTEVNGVMTQKYPKYDVHGKLYIYTVEEDPVPGYKRVTDGVTGYDLKNVVDKVPVSFIKYNDAGAIVPGRKFILQNELGEYREYTTDQFGAFTIPDLHKNSTYVLTEVFVQNDPFVNTHEVYYINVDTAGKIFIEGLELISADLDGNPDTQEYAYKITNVQKTIPKKSVSLSDNDPNTVPTTDAISEVLPDLNKNITYVIDQPKMDWSRMSEIFFIDTVDPALAIVPNSLRVYAIDDTGVQTDVTSIFTKELTNQARTITAMVASNYTDYDKLAGKSLKFVFDAYVAVTPSDLVAMHPDKKIPNTAAMVFNHDPNTLVKTNPVEVTFDVVGVQFEKFVETLDASGNKISKPLPQGLSATFELYNTETNAFIGEFTTNANGMVTFTNLGVGKYYFKETIAPQGYGLVPDVYFDVRKDDTSGQLVIDALDGKDGAVLATFANRDAITGFITDANLRVIDPMPELPTVNKQVKPKDQELQAGDPATTNKDYVLPLMRSAFDYVIDLKIPTETKNLSVIDLFDAFPKEIEIVGVVNDYPPVVGSGEGSTFVPATSQAGYIFNYAGGLDTSTERYNVFLNTNDRQTIDALAGKTVRITLPAKIKDSYTSSETMNLVAGKLPNTTTVVVNNEYTIDSSATVTPPTTLGVTFKKIGDIGSPLENYGLYDAQFELSHYDVNGVQGPDLPMAMTTTFTSNGQGIFRIPAELLPGKYVLTEIYVPMGYINEFGEKYSTNFKTAFDTYVIEVGATLADGSKGTKIYSLVDNGDETFTETFLTESAGTAELPVKIENKMTIAVPVNKVWVDNNDSANMRPQSVTMTIQRATVVGEPDVVDPVTGLLVPEAGDQADIPDTTFNDMANADTTNTLKVEIDIRQFPGQFYSEYLTRYDESGKLLNYYVIESPVPGYTPSYGIVTTVEDGYDDFLTDEIVVTNTLNVAEIILKKVDNSDPAQPVEGAEFNLSYTDETGAQLVRTLTTDAKGELDLRGLLPSTTFTLVETKAPQGYLKNTTVYTIVVDAQGNPTVYEKYVAPGDAGNFEVTLGEETRTVPAPTDTDSNATKQVTVKTLTVVDEKTKTPPPEKTVNNAQSYTLESLTKDFEYAVSVPVKTVEGYETFTLTDTVNKLLTIVDGTTTVTADGKDISTLGTITIDPNKQTISFTIDQNGATPEAAKAVFDQIANRTVKLAFKAKVKDGIAVEQLKDYVTSPGNESGIPNEATLTINDTPAKSNTVYVVPETPPTPTIKKTVNDVTDYVLKAMDEIFTYKVEVPVPTNVLGYASLSIEDTLSKLLEVSGDVKLTTVDAARVIAPLNAGPDYTLTNTTDTDPNAATDGKIKATFVDGYDYTKLAGKTVVMEFKAKLKTGVTPDQIKAYTNSKVPNTANFILNGTPGTESTVVVTPPENPTVDKKVNGEDKTILTDLTKPVQYTITATVPVNPTDYTKYVISDQLKDVFDFTETTATVTVDGITDTADITPVVSATGLVTSTMSSADVVAKYAGKTIVLKINAPFDPTKDLTNYLVAGELPNTVDVIVNDQPKVKDDAPATVPQGEVTLTKTADGNPLPAGTAASFKLYKQLLGAPYQTKDQLIGEYTTINGTLTVKGLEPGTYYFVETQAPAGYELNDLPRIFTVDTQGKTTAGENFTNFTVNNIKKDVPGPKKNVSDADQKNLENVDLSALTEPVTYEVTVPVQTVAGWTEFKITDPVDKALTVDQATIKVEIKNQDGTVQTTFDLNDHLTFETATNTITFVLAQTELTQLEGKNVVLTFNASIAMTAAEFIKAHPDAIVGNTAEINIGNQAIPTNTVTVTPPGEVPTPVKSINGDSSETPLKLGKKDQHFFYDVRMVIPTNTAGYESLTLTDTLESVLETDIAKIHVYVNDILDANLEKYISYDPATNLVKFEIDNNTIDSDFDFKTLAGKTIRLAIEANFKSTVTDADLKTYIVDPSTEVIVPNEATLKINNESKTSNTVNVTPPGDEPTIEKTVTTKTIADAKAKALLEAKNETFTYKVNVTVPSNVEGYTKIQLDDTLDSALEVVGKPVVTLSDGTTYQGPAPQVTGNKIQVLITDNFAAYAGKTITLTIQAKILDTITMDQIAHNYGNSAIPNKATLTFNNTSKDSNEVTVTPPGETPKPTKDVNAQPEITLKTLQEEFVYNVRYTVPTNVTGINKLTLTDQLKDVLVTSQDKITVYVDEVKDDALTQKAVLDTTNLVTFVLAQGDTSTLHGTVFENLAGKTIRVEIKASIKDGADLSAYPNRRVPNDATLKLNDDPTGITTPPVYVNPPLGAVTLTKVVDGNPLSGTQTATFNLYKQLGDTPDTATDTPVLNGTSADYVVNAASNKISIEKLEPGKYYFVETAAPDGYVLKNEPIPFEITANQTMPITLIWNNTTPGKTVPVKTVNDKEHLDLANVTDSFTYKVEVPVDKVDGWTKFELTDPVDKELTIDEASVKVVIGGTTYTLANTQDADVFTVANNLITFSFTQGDKIKALVGQTVILTFDAKITDLNQYLVAHPNAIVGNTASLDVGNGGTSSNEVTVTPPGDNPKLDKKVNGEKELKITNLTDKLSYTMDIDVPLNTRDITKIQMIDDFPGIFKLETPATVTVLNADGTPDNALTATINGLPNVITVNGQKVELLVQDADADQFAGKRIHVQINATIDETKNVADYLVEGSIPNEARLAFTNDPTKDIKDKATVTPPGEDPKPKKDVNGKPSLSLGTLSQVFTYHVGATVPSDITGFTKYVLVDNLEDVLETDLSRITVRV